MMQSLEFQIVTMESSKQIDMMDVIRKGRSLAGDNLPARQWSDLQQAQYITWPLHSNDDIHHLILPENERFQSFADGAHIQFLMDTRNERIGPFPVIDSYILLSHPSHNMVYIMAIYMINIMMFGTDTVLTYKGEPITNYQVNPVILASPSINFLVNEMGFGIEQGSFRDSNSAYIMPRIMLNNVQHKIVEWNVRLHSMNNNIHINSNIMDLVIKLI